MSMDTNAGYWLWRGLTCCVCMSDSDSLQRRLPSEKHINLSSYYPVINGTAEFYGHAVLTILQGAYLNSMLKRSHLMGLSMKYTVQVKRLTQHLQWES